MSNSNNTVQVIKLQRWYRQFYNYRHLRRHVVDSVPQNAIGKVVQVLNSFSVAQLTKGGREELTFEQCQLLLFNEEFSNLFATLLQSIFQQHMVRILRAVDAQNTQSKRFAASADAGDEGEDRGSNLQPQQKPLHTPAVSHNQKGFVKTVLSAILIAKFPDDLLGDGTDAPSTSSQTHSQVDYSELRAKGNKCFYYSKLLFKYLPKLILLIHRRWYSGFSQSDLTPYNEVKEFSNLVHSNLFILENFLFSFHDWKRLDSLLVIHSLEETFQQSYFQYLQAKQEYRIAQSDLGLLNVSEAQLHKIQEMLKRIIGIRKAMSRIEELKAAVEASNPQLFQNVVSENSVLGVEEKGNADASATISQQINPNFLQDSSNSQSNEPPINVSVLKQLEMLSKLAGIENERLAYEITLDPHYRLPIIQQALLKDLSPNEEFIGENEEMPMVTYLKTRLLRRMADQLINSLRKPALSSYSQVREGMIIPVLIRERFQVRDGSEFEQSFYLSAKVIQIHSATGSGNGKLLDVEYVVDGVIEKDVAFERVKLSSTQNNSNLLIQSLHDILQQIIVLIPNRKDLQAQLSTSFDPELLTQMITHDSLSPKQDLLPILLYIYEFLQSLQAEYRLPYSKRWINFFTQLFDDSTSSVDKNVNPLLQIIKERWIPLTRPTTVNSVSIENEGEFGGRLEEMISALPIYFERVTECVQEIQRDMANYYISLLAPVLHNHGQQFLLHRFQQRLTEGEISVLALTTSVRQQISPENNFALTVADLVEADLVGVNGLTLQAFFDIVSTETASTADVRPQDLLQGIMAKVFLTTLQVPHRLDSIVVVQRGLIPETFLFDVSRLSVIRDTIDKIALENSLLITIKRIISNQYKILLHETEETEFIHRIDVLLSQKDFAIQHINTECVRFIRSLVFLRQHQSINPYSGVNEGITSAAKNSKIEGESELVQLVEKATAEIIKEGNPVLNLFQTRIYKLLLRILLEKPYQQKMKQFSLQAAGHERNFRQLAALIKGLFNHNYRVYLPLYKAIIMACLQYSITNN